jgi:signal transduction histidine kinase
VDVQCVLRSAVESIRSSAAQARGVRAQKAVPLLREAQQQGREAVTELRRLLGLLRDSPEDLVEPAAVEHDRLGKDPRRLPLWTDGLLAAAVVALSVIEPLLWPQSYVPDLPPATPWSLILTGTAAATLGLRRIAPIAGAATLGVVGCFAVISGTPMTAGLATFITGGVLTWAAAARRKPSSIVAVAVLIVGMIGAVSSVGTLSQDNVIVALIVFGGTAVCSWETERRRSVAAAAAASADQLADEHRAASERAVRAERLTVARDLHDVVSHAVVVMTVQAAAAEALLPADPEGADRSLQLIEGVAATTLNELDRLFVAVSADHDGAAPSRDIPALVDRMRSGGLAVGLSYQATAQPPAVAYRVVQETLTNALRHAPHAHVQLTVTSSAAGTTVDVLDDGPGPIGDTSRRYGLVGLTERIQHVGGTIDTGPGPAGRGFHVHATIPPLVHQALEKTAAVLTTTADLRAKP